MRRTRAPCIAAGDGEPSRGGACEKRCEWAVIEDVLPRLGSCCFLIILEHLDGHPAFVVFSPLDSSGSCES